MWRALDRRNTPQSQPLPCRLDRPSFSTQSSRFVDLTNLFILFQNNAKYSWQRFYAGLRVKPIDVSLSSERLNCSALMCLSQSGTIRKIFTYLLSWPIAVERIGLAPMLSKMVTSPALHTIRNQWLLQIQKPWVDYRSDLSFSVDWWCRWW